MEEKTYISMIAETRTEIKQLGEKFKVIIAVTKQHPEKEGVDKGELISNVILSYRHLEDSAMRLGKAIQAYEGGKSIYDNNDAKRVAENGPVKEGFYNEKQNGNTDK